MTKKTNKTQYKNNYEDNNSDLSIDSQTISSYSDTTNLKGGYYNKYYKKFDNYLSDTNYNDYSDYSDIDEHNYNDIDENHNYSDETAFDNSFEYEDWQIKNHKRKKYTNNMNYTESESYKDK